MRIVNAPSSSPMTPGGKDDPRTKGGADVIQSNNFVSLSRKKNTKIRARIESNRFWCLNWFKFFALRQFRTRIVSYQICTKWNLASYTHSPKVYQENYATSIARDKPFWHRSLFWFFEVARIQIDDSIAGLLISHHIDARRREFRSHSAGETKGYESPF